MKCEGSKLSKKARNIYWEGKEIGRAAKGPFIIINVLKFRFFIEIVLTHPPQISILKHLCLFPFPSTHTKHSLLSIEYQMHCNFTKG